MRRPQASTLANCNGAASVQQVLDTVLGWSALNHHFDVAGFLFEHGGDINTNWNSHEPASILHTLVFEDDYEAMRFLIDRGIDMTINHYRWDATAHGWARLPITFGRASV